MTDPHIPRTLADLGALGVRLAVDDFGTGYSNFARLRTLPIHVLKLDRSLISGIAEDPATRHITSCVVDLAHGLGLETVAEGVETMGELDAVDGLGVDYVQGYILARPTPQLEFGSPALQRAASRRDRARETSRLRSRVDHAGAESTRR
jgi:EAL domain-containing protein (putative c-di-GMP-specific phosphodiesterase class I)